MPGRSAATKYLVLFDTSFATTADSPDSIIQDSSSHARNETDAIGFLTEDLTALLGQSDKQFWSTVLHNESIHHSLDSYLWTYKGLRERHSYDTLASLHRAVFMVYLRMSTRPRGMFNQTAEEFGTVLFNNYVFNTHTLLDIAHLYQASNPTLTTTLLENVFLQEPRFLTALEETVAFTVKKMNAIGKTYKRSGDVKPAQVQTDATYYLDALSRLSALVKGCPDTTRYINFAHKSKNLSLVQCLVNVHEQVVPLIRKQLQGKQEGVTQDYSTLLSIRSHIVNLFWTCISTLFLGVLNQEQPALRLALDAMETRTGAATKLSDDAEEAYCEGVLGLLQHCAMMTTSAVKAESSKTKEAAREGLLLAHCDVRYALADQLQNTTLVAQVLGHERVNYTVELIRACKSALNVVGDVSKTTGDGDGGMDSKQIVGLIQQVRDVMGPALSDDFIHVCLQAAQYQPEKVISNVFENNIPTALGMLTEAQRKTYKAPRGLLKSHNNKTQQKSAAADGDDRFQAYLDRTGRVAKSSSGGVELKQVTIKDSESSQEDIALLKRRMVEYLYDDEKAELALAEQNKAAASRSMAAEYDDEYDDGLDDYYQPTVDDGHATESAGSFKTKGQQDSQKVTVKQRNKANKGVESKTQRNQSQKNHNNNNNNNSNAPGNKNKKKNTQGNNKKNNKNGNNNNNNSNNNNNTAEDADADDDSHRTYVHKPMRGNHGAKYTKAKANAYRGGGGGGGRTFGSARGRGGGAFRGKGRTPPASVTSSSSSSSSTSSGGGGRGGSALNARAKAFRGRGIKKNHNRKANAAKKYMQG